MYKVIPQKDVPHLDMHIIDNDNHRPDGEDAPGREDVTIQSDTETLDEAHETNLQSCLLERNR